MDQFRTLSPNIQEYNEQSEKKSIKFFFVRSANPKFKLRTQDNTSQFIKQQTQNDSPPGKKYQLNNILCQTEHKQSESVQSKIGSSRNLIFSRQLSVLSVRVDEPTGDWSEDDWLELIIQIGTLQIPLQFFKKELVSASCGWLVSEIIRKMVNIPNIDYDPTKICALKTFNQDLLLDIQLAQLDRKLPSLQSGIILIPVFQEITDQFITNLKIVSYEDFDLVKKLGSGGFSVVYLVRKKSNGQFFAMKVIDKELMIQRDKIELIMNERNILVKLRHKRVVRLHYAFQTKKKLYFVLDLCIGGELFYHLRKQKRFSETQTRSCCIQILQGLQYLHKNNIIYRDLKPENIMIDADGYIKLIDFGLSKKVDSISQLNYTFCGSLEYMAPEMINISGHDYSLDFYTLGILLYEMTTGVPPFHARSRQELMKSIVKSDISFPPYVSSKLVNLIQCLCHKEKKRRIGMRFGVQEIFEHPFFKGEFKITPVVSPTIGTNQDLPFDNLFLKQPLDSFEQGPRCLSEEVMSKFSQMIPSNILKKDDEQSEDTYQFDQFADFSFNGKENY